MADIVLPPKPNLGETKTFWLRPKVGVKATGIVRSYVVDTPQRWKVEIIITAVNGPRSVVHEYRRDYIGRLIMFEHFDLIASKDDTAEKCLMQHYSVGFQ